MGDWPDRLGPDRLGPNRLGPNRLGPDRLGPDGRPLRLLWQGSAPNTMRRGGETGEDNDVQAVGWSV